VLLFPAMKPEEALKEEVELAKGEVVQQEVNVPKV
jgi:hypothetical protein